MLRGGRRNGPDDQLASLLATTTASVTLALTNELSEHLDGAAPLIGSSHGIRLVRERLERMASTDFTVLIEGASGPQPHPGSIEVFGEAAAGGGDGTLERAAVELKR